MLKKFTLGWIVFCVCLKALAAPLAVPPLTGRVVDSADVLSSSEEQRLEAAVLALESATGGQMAVLTVRTLGADESLEAYSLRVAETWRIGRKGRDNGAVLLVVTQDRQMRLEVGYGWEGAVNDARAGDIIRGMATFFRQNRYADGMVFAVQRMQAYVTGSEPPEALRTAAQPQTSAGTPWPLFVFFALIVLLILWKGRRGTRVYRGGRGGGGFFGGGGFSGGGGGGGFSGGGGGFGGGGASGRW